MLAGEFSRAVQNSIEVQKSTLFAPSRYTKPLDSQSPSQSPGAKIGEFKFIAVRFRRQQFRVSVTIVGVISG